MDAELSRLLEFAAKSRVEHGFGYLLADGTTDPARGIETWINARMTHVFALAVLCGRDDLRPLVAHGLAALEGPLQDSRYDGWFAQAPGDAGKQAYQHAFVVLAGASAAQAGFPTTLLEHALRVWDERFWDEQVGAVVDAWDQTWTVLDDYRGANANMHGVEAMLAAADALPARAAELRARCLRVVERFVHHEAGERAWRLPEHFDKDWDVELEHHVELPADPFQPYGVTVGHQFEWARLALHLSSVLDVVPDWLTEDARQLYDVAKARGWGADGQDGFVYTLDWQDQPVVTARMHWVLAEAISAAAVLGEHDDLREWQQHAVLFEDARSGSWHHELTPSGQVAHGTWSGQPDAYHVAQALLLPHLPVRGSVAAALKT